MKSEAYSDATSSMSKSPPSDWLKKRSYRSNSFLTLVSIILSRFSFILHGCEPMRYYPGAGCDACGGSVARVTGLVAAYTWDQLDGLSVRKDFAGTAGHGVTPILPPSWGASRIEALRGLWTD